MTKFKYIEIPFDLSSEVVSQTTDAPQTPESSEAGF